MKERVEAAFAAQDLNLDQAKPNNSDSITKSQLLMEHEKNVSDEPKTIGLENKELSIDECEETEITQNDSDKNTSDTHHQIPSTSLSLLAVSYSEEPDVSMPEEDSFAKSKPEIQTREPDITTSKEPYVTPLKEPEMTPTKETDVILSKEINVAPSKEPDMKLSKESDVTLLKETDLIPKQVLLKPGASPKFSLYTCGQTRSDMLKTALQAAALMKQKAELEGQAHEETEQEIGLIVSEESPEQSDVIKPSEPEHLEEPDMPFPVETEDSLPECSQPEKPHTSTLLSEPVLSSQENSIMSMSDISDVPLPVSETEDSLPFPEEVEDSRSFTEVETEDSLPVTETEDSQSETPVISKEGSPKASSPLPAQPDASLPVSERPEWGKPLLPSSEESSNDGAPENNMKLKNTILRTCFASLYRRQKLEKEQEYKDHLNGGLD